MADLTAEWERFFLVRSLPILIFTPYLSIRISFRRSFVSLLSVLPDLVDRENCPTLLVDVRLFILLFSDVDLQTTTFILYSHRAGIGFEFTLQRNRWARPHNEQESRSQRFIQSLTNRYTSHTITFIHIHHGWRWLQ